jgi:hypothetical protein
MKPIYYIGFACIALLLCLHSMEGFEDTKLKTTPSLLQSIATYISELTKLQLLLGIGTIVLLLFMLYKFVILK